MQSSPLRTLIVRHLRTCRHSPTSSAILRQTRSLSITPARLGNAPSPTTAVVGPPELLKRRYRPKPIDIDARKAEAASTRRRSRYASAGIIVAAIAMFGTVYLWPGGTPVKNDGPPPPIVAPSLEPVKEQIETVETGTSSVPHFPKTIRLAGIPAPNAAVTEQGEQDYTLIGLGIRTVSFLSIQVYVVGLYIAVADIAALQEMMIRTQDPVATALVAGEKDKLKADLLDPIRSEEIWNAVLKGCGVRTVLRIVPTRNTDFSHLRDGWIKGVTDKTRHFAQQGDQSFSDEGFGEVMAGFKNIFKEAPRRNLPKGEVLLLTRDTKGALAMSYEDPEGARLKFGEVNDERLSRLIWLLYLSGAKPSSEGARKSVVDGVMEYVERPVGTVATQVV